MNNARFQKRSDANAKSMTFITSVADKAYDNHMYSEI